MRTLYLIRHAQPKSQGERRCVSRTDLALDEVGIYQAERLRTWARGVPLTAIFSSPLQRCVQTALIMGDGRVPVQVSKPLREMDVGEWENLTFEEIRSRYPKEYAARGEHTGAVPPPGGESFDQAGARLIACMDSLTAMTTGDIAIVAHSGVNRGALCRLLGMPPDDVLNIKQPWGCINIIHWDVQDGCKVVSVGVEP